VKIVLKYVLDNGLISHATTYLSYLRNPELPFCAKYYKNHRGCDIFRVPVTFNLRETSLVWWVWDGKHGCEGAGAEKVLSREGKQRGVCTKLHDMHCASIVLHSSLHSSQPHKRHQTPTSKLIPLFSPLPSSLSPGHCPLARSTSAADIRLDFIFAH